MATVQTERVIAIHRDGQKEVVVNLSTLALSSGVAEIAIGTLDEVREIYPFTLAAPLVDAYVFTINVAKSSTNKKNGITITVKKMDTSAVTPTWGNAVTADIATAVLAIRAIGI